MCLILKYYVHICGYRWRGRCLWAPTWWACKAPPTTAHAPPLMFHPCTQRQSWWVSLTHTHTHTHLHIFLLAYPVWFDLSSFLSSVIVTELVTRVRYTALARISTKKDFSLSLFLSLKHICTHTHRHTLTSFSFLLQCMPACLMYISMPEHTLVPLLLVSTSSAWRWSHQKQSSQSELSETERTRERNRLVEKAGRRV